jgi:hypothetical protein
MAVCVGLFMPRRQIASVAHSFSAKGVHARSFPRHRSCPRTLYLDRHRGGDFFLADRLSRRQHAQPGRRHGRRVSVSASPSRLCARSATCCRISAASTSRRWCFFSSSFSSATSSRSTSSQTFISRRATPTRPPFFPSPLAGEGAEHLRARAGEGARAEASGLASNPSPGSLRANARTRHPLPQGERGKVVHSRGAVFRARVLLASSLLAPAKQSGE